MKSKKTKTAPESAVFCIQPAAAYYAALVFFFLSSKNCSSSVEPCSAWVEAVPPDTTVVMFPQSSHWVEQDAGPLANKTIHDWLNERPVDAKAQR